MEINYKTGNDTIAFSTSRFVNLIFIDALVNGAVQTALFDTGASMTVICEYVAKMIGIDYMETKIKGGNNNGAILHAKTGVIKELCIANVVIRDLLVAILPDEAMNVVDDNNNPFPAKILLGWDVISQLCWSFDMKSQKVRIEAGGKMPQNSNLGWNKFAILKVVYKDQEISLGFDSGHTSTMLDSSWKGKVENTYIKLHNMVGIGGSKEESVEIIDSIELSISGKSIVLNNIEIVNHSIYGAEEGAMQGLLGADIISGREWVIDYSSNYFDIK